MLRLDKILYNAITADESLMQVTGGRVKSTCFEVSPDEQDNTDLPYIIITDEGKRPSASTKDDCWMPYCWSLSAGIEVAAESPNEVDRLVMMAMQAVARYIAARADEGEIIPILSEEYPQTQGVAWDWTKPCYFDVVHYQCDAYYSEDDEEENN